MHLTERKKVQETFPCILLYQQKDWVLHKFHMQLLLGWNLLQISTWLAIALSRHPGYERIPSSRLSNSCRVVGLGSVSFHTSDIFSKPIIQLWLHWYIHVAYFQKMVQYNSSCHCPLIPWLLHSKYICRPNNVLSHCMVHHGYPTFGIVGILHHTWNMTF